MRIPEQNSIISGIGISRIGRRLGLPGLELTEESSRAAIADAGLELEEIAGIATLGDTSAEEIRASLGLDAPEIAGDSDHGGLLSPLYAQF